MPDPDEDLTQLRVDALKEGLKEEKLKVSGNKQVLIDRLKERHLCLIEGGEQACSMVYPAHVTIPHPDGSRKPIKTHDLQDTVKILGFYHSLDPKDNPHIKEMVQKCID